MKKFIKNYWHYCALTLLFSCSEPEIQREKQGEQITPDPVSSKTDDTHAKNPGPGGGVLMQAFYWDVPAGGTWYNTVKSKLASWDAAGISAIWLPPVSKAQNGPFSMGYDPADYFDFGHYNQHGSVETRFGSKSELQSLISTAHNYNIDVYADIVINHNSGGDLEANPNTGTNTYTDFNPASGKFYRSYNDFHPNGYASNDEGIFGGFPDLSHSVPYVQDWLWKRSDGVGKYYKNTMGFDGFRFDYVKGFGGWVVRDWMNNVGGFAVGEYWDGNAQLLQNWVNATNRTSSAFDFACYYRMDEAFDGNNLNKLNDDMLWKRDAAKAVTFVANHDTDIIWDKMHAYAYIMTHEGYPTIFYRDYEEWLDKNKLNNLIWIHRNKAVGSTTILYADNDEYVARRNGSPGLVVYLNDSNSWVERWVETNWSSTVIKDYTGNSSWEPTTQSGKWVKIQCPPNSYTIWSPK
ncbi:alpha-amylase [Fulvivirga kasyanovii]|uniref:Alpha-amylase n=1 Tax=Fulvivirga kasyanovii TaxID=396812 RepID=A0ABW9RW23_9BACT|nr:alpha-amylase [Fulvivirga kasyanovii]MTI28000.1 alpha-amylase [Fulvivirga kasyanovii]